MRFYVEEVEVLWPYDYIYPEQYRYMCSLKRTLSTGHAILEMPTGTGKTISLLALILAYQYANPSVGKLIYCTRTVQEMDKVVEELRRVVAHRCKVIAADYANATANANATNASATADVDDPPQPRKVPPPPRDPAILGVCLSSRRNLCIHGEVSAFDNRNKVDALCRNRTATFVRERKASGEAGTENIELCDFFEGFERTGRALCEDAAFKGIYGLHELRELGRAKGVCPYFFSRHALNLANVVVYNYQYMLDPKISSLVSRDIGKDSIVVFDEAHNIDNICIEALSVSLDRATIHAASTNLFALTNKVSALERTGHQRLQHEYNQLLRGLSLQQVVHAPAGGAGGAAAAPANAGTATSDVDRVWAAPVLSPDILADAVPGNIRKAKHFCMFLRTFLEFLRNRMDISVVTMETPTQFLLDVQQRAPSIRETRALRFCYDRLQSLFRTLELTDLDEYTPLVILTNFATLVATYNEGFSIIFEPYDERTPGVPDPKLQLSCLDASLAMRPVFEKFRSVVITSGTLSPLDVYARMLKFTPSVMESFSMSLTRNVICPMIVSKGSDQVAISSKLAHRSDEAVLMNYGQLLLELCTTVPDGIVAFFTSYAFMENVVSMWQERGLLQRIRSRKLVFVETRDIVETTLALDAYKKACSCGRGALFLSIARGKVAEGIDFDRHYGRCVVMFGIPYQYTQSQVLRARLNFLHDKFEIREGDFLTFDAMRQTAQCVGRVIRSKTDYGMMVFADQRYNRVDKRSKLPPWILKFLDKTHMNLSTDGAIELAKKFFREIAQPRSRTAELGVTMLSEKDLNERIERFQSLMAKATSSGEVEGAAERLLPARSSTSSSGSSRNGGGQLLDVPMHEKDEDDVDRSIMPSTYAEPRGQPSTLLGDDDASMSVD